MFHLQLKQLVGFTFVDVDPLNPGEWTSLHHCIGDADRVYPVHHSLKNNQQLLA